MALTVLQNWVWKWLTGNWSTIFDIYWKMFDPNLPDASWYIYDEYWIHNETSNFNLVGFQPWNEVCLALLTVENRTSSEVSWYIEWIFQQWDGSDRIDWDRLNMWYDYIPWQDSEYTYWYAVWMWVWIDPDEIRPDYTQYRFKRNFMWSNYYKTFTVSNLSFDDDPHPAWYMRVEWDNLCYVPPSIYSGSSTTWYKHIIQNDSWYSGGSGDPWYIRIPSSSSDHHIYYVTEYGTVYRTKESYAWSGDSSSVWSNRAWYIRMPPSTSWTPETAWYNYLCYVDGWWYRRRMWIWEI